MNKKPGTETGKGQKQEAMYRNRNWEAEKGTRHRKPGLERGSQVQEQEARLCDRKPGIGTGTGSVE